MKKLRNLAICFILALILGVASIFSGCGPSSNESNDEVDDQPQNNIVYTATIDGIEGNIIAGSDFSVVGKTLVINEQGRNEPILVKITENMVQSMPDMSTAGEKTIKISYRGITYDVKITAVSKQVLLDNISQLLSDMQSGKYKTVSGNIQSYMYGKVFDDEQEIDTKLVEFEASINDLETLRNRLLSVEQTKIIENLYYSFIKGLAATTSQAIQTGNIKLDGNKIPLNFEDFL